MSAAGPLARLGLAIDLAPLLRGETETGAAVGPDPLCVRGHFPGRPLVPAVAILALVEAAAGARSLREAAAPRSPHVEAAGSRSPHVVAGLRGVRFRLPVHPGAPLTIRLGEGEEGGWRRFAVGLGGEEAAAGRIALHGPAALDPPAEDLEGDMDPGAPPAADLALPHQGPARLVQRVERTGDGTAAALAVVPADSAFVHEGTAPALLALEAIAQAAVLLRVGTRAGPSGPSAGMLVRVGEADLAARRLVPDVAFEVVVELEAGAGALRLVRGRVRAAGREIARARLGLLDGADTTDPVGTGT